MADDDDTEAETTTESKRLSRLETTVTEIKDAVQQLWALRQAPGDEAASNTGVARSRPFPIDPVAITVATTEESEAAGMAYCRREAAARDYVHGGEENRVLNFERLR